MASRVLTFFVVSATALMALPAFAQNINTIEARMDRMEREMQTLSRSVFKGDVPPPQIGGGVAGAQETAAMELRLSQLEDQIRRLTGQIEEQGYQTRQLSKKLDDLVGSGKGVQQSGTSASVTSSSSPSAVTAQPTSSENVPYQLGTLNKKTVNSPAGLYDQAFSYLQTNDYASAEKTFDDFIKQYPDHSLAANAKYWLGETHYARDDFEQASRAFALSYQDHPEGQKAPDTLLKLAMSLGNQGMKDEACLTLGELKKRFPNGPVSVMKKADEETKSYGCG